MESKFTRAEDKGRKITEELLATRDVKDLKFTEGKYDIYDCTFSDKKDTLWLGEIKCRDGRYEKYDDMLIEKKKLDALNELVEPFKEDKVKLAYINVYEGKKTAKIASIRGLNLNCREESHVKTTSGNNNLVSKAVGYIKNFNRIKF